MSSEIACQDRAGASTATATVWTNQDGYLGLSLIYHAIFLPPCPLPISPVSAHSNRPLPIFFGVEGNQTRPMCSAGPWDGRFQTQSFWAPRHRHQLLISTIGYDTQNASSTKKIREI
jgi:hypothetical protein